MIEEENSNIIMQGATLHPADPGVTINGVQVSLGSSDLVIGAHTVPLASFSIQTMTPVNQAELPPSVVSDISMLENDVIAGGLTLTPGAVVTLADGKSVSIGSSSLVLDGHTLDWNFAATPTETTSDNGGLIMQGLGSPSTVQGTEAVRFPLATQTRTSGGSLSNNGSQNETVEFTGNAARRKEQLHKYIVGIVVGSLAASIMAIVL